ncbi:MAG TPA: prephenate dehydratase [Alphaproteobacteria bacterium]|nr:prephenate dehydratase [Paracoccaceae bacterium]RCL80882.1 MAG: prephenate dehydratase [SAR116 cluster bacterium]RPH13617.1 MAG: prephenate dehydratase [Alphaproteobacteria bacterium TMED150]HCJ61139.1 prephenate dehydratase [Alphaproteobacteria bacterium]HCY48335.1 prephenate dehydratase [Alphaproteobacteria bacterium]|tara:strand:+ start:373 stop:1275 length:903 start_codon:yes stop_codon:yes gene_type:complete
MTSEEFYQLPEAKLKALGGDPAQTICFQGEAGAYSHLACLEALPDMVPMACNTFEEAMERVHNGTASRVLLPVENSIYGRVADIHHLLPGSGLYIVGEHFMRVHHMLLGLKQATLDQITTARSHAMALGQCMKSMRELGIKAVQGADTAGSAREISQQADVTQAAIASKLAAAIYDLQILRTEMEDEAHNTTRFLVMSGKPNDADAGGQVMTSFVFQVRNVPAALYKALGGFATNGVNMTKLESYQIDGSFNATQFYADIIGHPEDENVRMALEELNFFSRKLSILGVYPQSELRRMMDL